MIDLLERLEGLAFSIVFYGLLFLLAPIFLVSHLAVVTFPERFDEEAYEHSRRALKPVVVASLVWFWLFFRCFSR
jgi:hypothetical protein